MIQAHPGCRRPRRFAWRPARSFHEFRLHRHRSRGWRGRCRQRQIRSARHYPDGLHAAALRRHRSDHLYVRLGHFRNVQRERHGNPTPRSPAVCWRAGRARSARLAQEAEGCRRGLNAWTNSAPHCTSPRCLRRGSFCQRSRA